MTHPPHHSPSHDHDKPYAEDDLGEVAATDFTQQPAPNGGVIVAGTCPRCHGRTRTEFQRGLPGTGSKGLFDWLSGGGRHSSAETAEEDPLATEVHFCECGHVHPLQPADAAFLGCGASWRLRRQP